MYMYMYIVIHTVVKYTRYSNNKYVHSLCEPPCLVSQVESQQIDLLNHPLVTSLLNYKWTRYGQLVYLINVGIYLFFLTFITSFALVVPAPNSSLCEWVPIVFTSYV